MAEQNANPDRKLTWLITGCSSGFGLSLARHVQTQGHRVIATSRNPSRNHDVVSEIESRGGKWLALDVTDSQSGDFIQELEKSGEQIDVLVNNAGFSTFAPVETHSEDDIRAQMETMYFGPIRLIKALIPFMRERKSGVIANFSSGAALDGNPTMGPYAGAKAALDATSRVLAKEVAAFGIRVLTVVIGTSNTSFGQGPTPNPVPEFYKDSMVDMMIQAVKVNKIPLNVDKDKAMKAVFEVVSRGDHADVGMLPLGPDMVARVRTVQKSLGTSLDAFEEVANRVRFES